MTVKKTNEDMTTSGIAVYDMTRQSEPDSTHYNKKCFDVDKCEFNSIIKRSAVPDRIQKYMANFKDSNIFVNYKSVKLNLSKYLGGKKK